MKTSRGNAEKKARRAKRAPPTAWQLSEQWKAISREAMRSWNASFHLQPRCGAVRKWDGNSCRNLPLENGRCRFHGGRTPKGDNWHRPRWPKADSPDSEAKLQTKLQDLDQRAVRRMARKRKMTADEKATYEKARKANAPSSVAERERRKMEKRQRVEFAVGQTPARDPTFDGMLEQLDADRRRLEAEIDRAKQMKWDVFG